MQIEQGTQQPEAPYKEFYLNTTGSGLSKRVTLISANRHKLSSYHFLFLVLLTNAFLVLFDKTSHFLSMFCLWNILSE